MEGDSSLEALSGREDWAQAQPAALARALHRLETCGVLDEGAILEAFCFLPRVARIVELAAESLRERPIQQLDLPTALVAAESHEEGDHQTSADAAQVTSVSQLGAQVLRQRRRELENLTTALFEQYFPRMKQTIRECFSGAELSELHLEPSFSRLENEFTALREQRQSLEKELRAVLDS
jgi:hypothetical protein